MKNIDQLALEVVHRMDEELPTLSMESSDKWHIEFARRLLEALNFTEYNYYKIGIAATVCERITFNPGGAIRDDVGNVIDSEDESVATATTISGQKFTDESVYKVLLEVYRCEFEDDEK